MHLISSISLFRHRLQCHFFHPRGTNSGPSFPNKVAQAKLIKVLNFSRVVFCWYSKLDSMSLHRAYDFGDARCFICPAVPKTKRMCLFLQDSGLRGLSSLSSLSSTGVDIQKGHANSARCIVHLSASFSLQPLKEHSYTPDYCTTYNKLCS